MNAFAVGQLQLAPSDRVLEIGFGGGSTLAALLNTAAFVAGVDRSRDVISWAKRHFAKAIESGRAEFRQGNVESLPFNEAAFDKVCTVNTVYFWTSLDAGFARDLPRPQIRRSSYCWLPAQGENGPHGHAQRYFHDARARRCRGRNAASGLPQRPDRASNT